MDETLLIMIGCIVGGIVLLYFWFSELGGERRSAYQILGITIPIGVVGAILQSFKRLVKIDLSIRNKSNYIELEQGDFPLLLI